VRSSTSAAAILDKFTKFVREYGSGLEAAIRQIVAYGGSVKAMNHPTLAARGWVELPDAMADLVINYIKHSSCLLYCKNCKLDSVLSNQNSERSHFERRIRRLAGCLRMGL